MNDSKKWYIIAWMSFILGIISVFMIFGIGILGLFITAPLVFSIWISIVLLSLFFGFSAKKNNINVAKKGLTLGKIGLIFFVIDLLIYSFI